MTDKIDDGGAALRSLFEAMRVSRELLEPLLPTIERYQAERRRMESVGYILHPSLAMNIERNTVDAATWPAIKAARDFVLAMQKAEDDLKKAMAERAGR